MHNKTYLSKQDKPVTNRKMKFLRVIFKIASNIKYLGMSLTKYIKLYIKIYKELEKFNKSFID